GRVALADGLAQARRGHLDRDPALRDPVERQLVEAPQVAVGPRPVGAPHLHQVRMREQVEQAAARRLAEHLEVALPDLLGIDRARRPDVPVGMVDRLLADEVDGADHVVPRAPVEQVRHAVLAAGHEVGLDADLQPLLCDELAVRVEIVDRVLAPERVLPDVERLPEAVDVLGRPQLPDPRLLGRLAIARDVSGGEVLGGGRAVAVGTEVHVIVGEHQGERSASSSSASRRSVGVVTFRLSAGDSTTWTRPPARSTSLASSVAAASTSSGWASARASAARRKTCGVCTAHSAERSSVSSTRPASSARFTVSVTRAAATTASAPDAASAASAASNSAGVASGRAASCTITGSSSGSAPAASSAARTE